MRAIALLVALCLASLLSAARPAAAQAVPARGREAARPETRHVSARPATARPAKTRPPVAQPKAGRRATARPADVQPKAARPRPDGRVVPPAGAGLVVMAPAQNAVIEGSTVTVRFLATGIGIVSSGVPLAQAGKQRQFNRPQQGHLRLTLDARPASPWYHNGPFTFTDVPAGSHRLTVELVTNDHSPLNPPVVQSVEFKTVATRAKAGPVPQATPPSPQPANTAWPAAPSTSASQAQPTSPPRPQLTITAPLSGAVITGSVVTVAFKVSNSRVMTTSVPLSAAGQHPELNRPDQVHLHLTLDVQPMVVWYVDRPYTFANVPAGQHQLTVELVNNDHSALSPPVVRTILFRTAGPQRLPVTGRLSYGGWPAGLALGSALALLGARLRRTGYRQRS